MENTWWESGSPSPARLFPARPFERASADAASELWVTGLSGMIGKDL